MPTRESDTQGGSSTRGVKHRASGDSPLPRWVTPTSYLTFSGLHLLSKKKEQVTGTSKRYYKD